MRNDEYLELRMKELALLTQQQIHTNTNIESLRINKRIKEVKDEIGKLSLRNRMG